MMGNQLRPKGAGNFEPAEWAAASKAGVERQSRGTPAQRKIRAEPRTTCEGVASAGVAGDAKPQVSGWQPASAFYLGVGLPKTEGRKPGDGEAMLRQ